MKRQKGFTLIELLIVVAITGIIAAIAIPSLVRARVASNESATIGDIRTVISAQAAYQSANGGYFDKNWACLAQNGGCVPGVPSTAPTFLDSQLASLLPKSGYSRSVPSLGFTTITDTTVSPTSTNAYVYAAVPTAIGQTGVRGFGGDSSGIMCYHQFGGAPPNAGGQLIPAPVTCITLN